MKVRVAIPGSLSLIVASVDVKQHRTDTERRSSVKVELAVLGSPSLIILMVSVDVKQHRIDIELRSCVKVGVAILGSNSVANKPFGFCRHEAS